MTAKFQSSSRALQNHVKVLDFPGLIFITAMIKTTGRFLEIEFCTYKVLFLVLNTEEEQMKAFQSRPENQLEEYQRDLKSQR